MMRLLAAAALLVPVIASAQDKVELNRITRVVVTPDGVEITGSRTPSFNTFTMSNPPRLVIDISEAVFVGVPEVIAGQGLVTGVKTASYGSASAAIARVLVGFERPVETDLQVRGNTLNVRILTGGPPQPPVVQAPPRGLSADEAAEAARKEEAARQKAAEAAAQRAEEARRAQEEAARAAAARAEADRKRAEEARKKAEEEARAKAAAEARAREEARRRAEEERKAAEAAARAEAERRREQEAQAKEAARRAEEERRRQEAEAREAARRAEEERQAQLRAQREAEAARRAEEERRRQEAEAREAARRAQEERRRQEAEAREAARRAQEESAAEARRRRDEARRQREEAARQEALRARRAPPDGTRTVTLVGFRPDGGGARVFVRTDAPVDYELREEDETTVVIVLPDTRIGATNNARFLDTSFFGTPVLRVDPREVGDEVHVVIKLREAVPYQARQQDGELVLVFQGSQG